VKKIPALLACLLMVFAAHRLGAQTDTPPNIIVILCDDLGQGDPGCYNPQSKIPTPNIDRLAAEGMRFDDMHTPSSVCTPTRYGTLTGRYCWRSRLKNGVLWSGYEPALIEEDRQTLASFLQDRGYTTAAIGKWHLGWNWATTDGQPVSRSHFEAVDFSQPVTRGPADVGFDYCHLIPASLDMAPYLWLETDRAAQAPTEQTPGSDRRWNDGGGFWRAGAIAPGFNFYDVVPNTTEQAVAFIERSAAAQRRNTDNPQPFFLYMPTPAPHTPWMPAPEFQGATQVGWYGDFVAQTDWSLGRVLAALDRNGLTDNTLIIFTSDNGSHWPEGQMEEFGHDANNGWRGMKADIWEAGHRVPFIARWPGTIEPGSISQQTLCLTDIFATCVEALGEDLPDDAAEDSISFLSVLNGQATQPVREAIVHHSLGGTFAIRQGDWKLVLGNLGSGGFTAPRNLRPGSEDAPEGIGGQLYNLSNDPAEQHNVWAENPEVVDELTALLERYKTEGRSR